MKIETNNDQEQVQPLDTNASPNTQKAQPETRNFLKLALLLLTIKLGAINQGYQLSYLTLVIETLFEILDIEKDDPLHLSLINVIILIGCFVGSVAAYYMKQKLTNKSIMYIADMLGIISLFTLIPNFTVIMIFRFVLGLSIGINSVIMPIQIKSMSPEKYQVQFGMVIGYFSSTGLLLGFVIGIGFLFSRGKGSFWWQIVFILPPLICFTRACLVYYFFNHENPEQLMQRGRYDEARAFIEMIYLDQDQNEVYDKIKNKVSKQPKDQGLLHLFKDIRHQKTIGIGICCFIFQQWCGSFAVFFYGAQINERLAKGNLDLLTLYTNIIGLCMFFPQFFNIKISSYFGLKKTLIIAGSMMLMWDIVITIVTSLEQTDDILVLTIILLFLQVATFSVLVQPNTWSLTAQLNDADGQYFCVLIRWLIEVSLIDSFPYIERDLTITGGFIIFSVVCFLFLLFTIFFIKDTTHMTQDEIDQWYSGKRVVVQQD